jgi:hypothetical protein
MNIKIDNYSKFQGPTTEEGAVLDQSEEEEKARDHNEQEEEVGVGED